MYVTCYRNNKKTNATIERMFRYQIDHIRWSDRMRKGGVQKVLSIVIVLISNNITSLNIWNETTEYSGAGKIKIICRQTWKVQTKEIVIKLARSKDTVPTKHVI